MNLRSSLRRVKSGGSAAETALLAPALPLPVTACVLLYGDYPDLADKTLQRMAELTPDGCVRWRLGLNAVSHDTRRVVARHRPRLGDTTVVESGENLFKYPMMSKLFQASVIDTEWLLWFDDDSYPIHRGWLVNLGLAMEARPDVSMWGRLRFVRPGERTLEVVRSASWYRGLPLEIDNERRAVIRFVEGGFWAVRTSVIETLRWPDPRLIHNGGDYLLGEALRQGGFRCGDVALGVKINGAARRSPRNTPPPV